MAKNFWDDNPELKAQIEAERRLHELQDRFRAANPLPDTDEGIISALASEVEPTAIQWIWPNWIARGKYHVLAGGQTAGKSIIGFDLLAKISAGGLFPGNMHRATAADVMIYSAEDGVQDTIKPRLMVAGANCDRVRIVWRRKLDPSTDLDKLNRELDKMKDPQALLMDPITTVFSDKVDSHKNAEARRGLQPIIDLCEDRNIALIGIAHYSKGTSEMELIERVTGSGAITQLARIVIGCYVVNPDTGERVFARIKNNIGPLKGGFEYKLNTVLLNDYNIEAQQLIWGDARNEYGEKLLRKDKDGGKTKLVIAYLREKLADGNKETRANLEAYVKEVFGASYATLRDAQTELGIVVEPFGRYLWKLPYSR